MLGAGGDGTVGAEVTRLTRPVILWGPMFGVDGPTPTIPAPPEHIPTCGKRIKLHLETGPHDAECTRERSHDGRGHLAHDLLGNPVILWKEVPR